MEVTEPINRVSFKGKVSKLNPLRFTPTGLALLEVVVAVNQSFLGDDSVGYFEVVVSDSEAIEMSNRLKIGKLVTIEGSLWSRRYKDRSGKLVTEKKVIAQKIVGGC